MDKLDHYRTCIQTLLEQHSQFKISDEDVDNELFFDPVRDHYQDSASSKASKSRMPSMALGNTLSSC